MILLAMAMFVWWPNPLTYVLAAALVGARQLGLAILMHDGSHGLLYRDRQLNHRVSQWLLGWPIGADMPTYRNYHLEHHLMMAVPCYRLPQFYQYLKQSRAAEKMLVTNSYLSVFRLITSRREDDDNQGERKQTPRRRFSGLVMEEDPVR